MASIIRNYVTRVQPTTWTDLVQQAKVGEMCAQPMDPTLSVKLEVIQDQLKQLTAEKEKITQHLTSCFTGRSESRPGSHSGSPNRCVRFDHSADRGVQDYRDTKGDSRDDCRTRSNECQSYDN